MDLDVSGAANQFLQIFETNKRKGIQPEEITARFAEQFVLKPEKVRDAIFANLSQESRLYLGLRVGILAHYSYVNKGVKEIDAAIGITEFKREKVFSMPEGNISIINFDKNRRPHIATVDAGKFAGNKF